MNLDHHLTLFLRALGARHLLFWKFVAAHGMWLFAGAWVVFSVFGWMGWWRPLPPLFLSYMTLLIVQSIVKRRRPNFEKISGYQMWIQTYSFPSGHSTESAVLAVSLMVFPVFPSIVVAVSVSLFLIMLAVLVMYSRLAVGVHYVTDVVAGSMLGVLYALAFFFVE